MIERLEGFAKDEFQTIMNKRNVIENLNSLEDLITDAKRRKARATTDTAPPTPPHLLQAPAVGSAHLAPHFASQQSQLNAKLQTAQSQNATLAQTAAAQQVEIEALLDGLEAVARDLDSAADGLGGEASDLSQEMRDAEVQMAGT